MNFLLKELGTLKNGLNYNSSNVQKGTKLIGIPNFGDRYIANFENLAEVDFKIVTEDYLLKNGDILFVRSNGNKDLVGRSMLIEDIPEEITFSGFCIRFRPDLTKVRPLFLLYLFKSPFFRKLLSRGQQTSISNLNQDILGSLPINLPSLKEQDILTSLLHSITKKIENNNMINDNLFNMAYQVYMHYFHHKKENAKISDILIEGEKSSIKVREAKIKSGLYPFFTSGDTVLEWDSYLVDGRNIYLNTGGNAGVKFYVGKSAYSTDTWCVTATKNLEDYLYLLLTSIKKELSLKYFQGTGLKHLQKSLLKDRLIYLPNEDEIFYFNEQVKPMLNMISNNSQENKTLIEIRDWLLPMIMNGQARISDG